MKEQVAELVNESIKELGVFVSDAYFSEEENKKVFNIELDSEEIIDLNKTKKTAYLRISCFFIAKPCIYKGNML